MPGEPFGAELDNTVYALDSTIIDVCLSLCPWAPFERSRGAVKMHTLPDLRGSIPTHIDITHRHSHDVLALDRIAFEPGAFYVMDRGYLSFGHLFRIHRKIGVHRLLIARCRGRSGLPLLRARRAGFVEPHSSERSSAAENQCLDRLRSSRSFPAYRRRSAPCDRALARRTRCLDQRPPHAGRRRLLRLDRPIRLKLREIRCGRKQHGHPQSL